MSELNKVFDAPTREAKRKILDNYPISADDKNKFLNKVGNGGDSSTTEYIDIRGYDIATYSYSFFLCSIYN